MKICPKSVDFSVLPMETRFPFQYGIASMTALPHLVVRAEFEIDGSRSTGVASEGLPPKWFTKNPMTTFEEQDLPEMLAVIRNSAKWLSQVQDGLGYFELWQGLCENQLRDSNDSHPPLLKSLGVSLMERVILGCGLPSPRPATPYLRRRTRRSG